MTQSAVLATPLGLIKDMVCPQSLMEFARRAGLLPELMPMQHHLSVVYPGFSQMLMNS